MDIQPVQQCRTLDGWVPVEIQSASDPTRKYTILVNPWGNVRENVCECEGYTYRGQCRHQREATDQLCMWHELIGPEKQTTEQRKDRTCPRCGGATQWVMEVIDEET